MNIIDTLVKIAEKQGVVNCNLDNLKAGGGQGYLGSINTVNLKGKTKCGKEKQLSFVIKTAATDEVLRRSGIVEVFAREIELYKSILPVFYNFEKDRGIENPFPIVAKCHYISEKTNPEILVLQDLNSDGYVSCNRKMQLDEKHVKIALEGYGRFHAVSFAMKDQNSELFETLTKSLDNIFEIFMKLSGIFYAFIRKSKLALASLDPQTKTYMKYETFLNGIEQRFSDLSSCCNQYYVVLHGDSWMNNMLVKYENNSNEPVDIRLIDFQFSRLGSPVCDLAYFLVSCATETILENMDKYKRVYYDSLSKHIKLLGSNPDKVYPISIFEEQWKKYFTFGLISSGLINFALLSEDDEIRDFADVTQSGNELGTAFDYDISNMCEFNDRMKCLIEHFVKNDFI